MYILSNIPKRLERWFIRCISPPKLITELIQMSRDKKDKKKQDALDIEASDKLVQEAEEKQAEQGGEWGSRGKSPLTSTSRSPLDRPQAGGTETTSRGIRQKGGAGRKAGFDRSLRRVYGVKGKTQRPTRYKDVDRSTIRGKTPTQETDYAPPALKNSMQKQVRPMQGPSVVKPQRGTGVRTPGMPQQQGKQGPTTAWGDPTRASKPTMRQQMPWDEKSIEKDERLKTTDKNLIKSHIY